MLKNDLAKLNVNIKRDFLIMKETKQKRKRGIALTNLGWQKLQKRMHESENCYKSGSKYTFEELSQKANLDAVTVARILDRKKRVDHRSLKQFFKSFELELDKTDYHRPNSDCGMHEKQMTRAQIVDTLKGWEEVVDVSVFYGRTEELIKLEQWSLNERCRLIIISGLGGIGKTLLCAKFAKKIHGEFDYVIWRSLIEQNSAKFTQQPMVVEYVSEFCSDSLPQFEHEQVSNQQSGY